MRWGIHQVFDNWFEIEVRYHMPEICIASILSRAGYVIKKLMHSRHEYPYPILLVMPP